MHLNRAYLTFRSLKVLYNTRQHSPIDTQMAEAQQDLIEYSFTQTLPQIWGSVSFPRTRSHVDWRTAHLLISGGHALPPEPQLTLFKTKQIGLDDITGLQVHLQMRFC